MPNRILYGDRASAVTLNLSSSGTLDLGANTLTMNNDLTIGGGSAAQYLGRDGAYHNLPSVLSLFLDNAASGIAGYLSLITTVPTDTEQTAAAAITIDGTVIEEFALAAATFDFISAQLLHLHLHLAKTAGTKTATAYVEVYHRTSGGTETLLGTSDATIDLTGSSAAYELHISVADTVFAATDRFVLKVLGNEGGAGTDPTITLYYEGDTNSRIEVGAQAAGTSAPHDILSATHTDTLAAAIAAGDLIIGNATPKWSRLAAGAQYKVLAMGAALPAWSSYLLDGTAGGKTVLNVFNTKTLTLTAADDYTLTIPATGTTALGTGTSTRIASWMNTNTIQASTLVKSGAGVLTLSAAADHVVIFEGTGGTLVLNGYSLTVANTASISGTNTGDQSGANPTASVGLTAVNGAAGTFMRSDGAPALDVGIVPTWTGIHTHDNTTDSTSVSTGAIHTTGGMGVAKTLFVGGDIATVAWADYGGTSTIVGWSSFTSQIIRYKKVGNIVFVAYVLSGTSNAANITFTLPYTSVNNTVQFNGNLRAVDNGSSQANPGRSNLPANSATVTCTINWGGGGWTASGTKTVEGEFWYIAS